MLNVEKTPIADNGFRWVLSHQYPKNLAISQYAYANVFGVITCEVEKIYDSEASKTIVLDETLVNPSLSKLYQSSGASFWLARLFWIENTGLMITKKNHAQKNTAIALVAEDLKPFLATAQKLKALLKVANNNDSTFILVGIQIPNDDSSQFLTQHL